MSDSPSFTPQRSTLSPPQFLNSLLDSTQSNLNLPQSISFSFSTLPQPKLISLRNYIHSLLSQIEALTHLTSQQNSKLLSLHQKLQSQSQTINFLILSKSQIEDSVCKILEYNTQYLQIIEEKERFIVELEEWRDTVENKQIKNEGYQSNKGLEFTVGMIHKVRENNEQKYKLKRNDVSFVQSVHMVKSKKKKEGLLDKVKEYVNETQGRYRREKEKGEEKNRNRSERKTGGFR